MTSLRLRRLVRKGSLLQWRTRAAPWQLAPCGEAAHPKATAAETEPEPGAVHLRQRPLHSRATSQEGASEGRERSQPTTERLEEIQMGGEETDENLGA